MYSGFDKMNMVHYGSNWFLKVDLTACIKLMHAHVLQFETLRAATIMLEVKGAMDEVWSISSLPNNEFSECIFKKEDLIDGF